MSFSNRSGVAVLFPAHRGPDRFTAVFEALKEQGLDPEPAPYRDEDAGAIKAQLLGVHAVLVWVNPIEAGRNRSTLDALLRELAAAGVFVSAHPDTIDRMGTKEVLYRTRHLGWGCDTHRYSTGAELREGLIRHLPSGPRVLKRARGNGGTGVWKIELAGGDVAGQPDAETLATVRHAERGGRDTQLTLGEFVARCEPYFAEDGLVIDQPYLPRLTEGSVRAYLVHDRVAGFGHQAVNALCPPPGDGSPPPEPSPRLYHPETLPAFQALRERLELSWVPEMQRVLGLSTDALPVLWDADFLLGPLDPAGEDTWVLCEINVCSVSPFPGSALPRLAGAVAARLGQRAGCG